MLHVWSFSSCNFNSIHKRWLSGKESACNTRDTETQVQFLGWEDPLEEETATHSNILAWKIPWTEEPGGLQSMGVTKQSDTTEQLKNRQKQVNWILDLHTIPSRSFLLFSFQTSSWTFSIDKEVHRSRDRKDYKIVTRSQSIALDVSTLSLYYLYMLMNFPGSGNKHPGGEFNEGVNSLSNRGLKSK